MKKHYRQETDCLNCGADLQGHFCHNCGQENLEMKESFGHMATHAISDYFHFDYQFFHTLKPLLFKPGKLSTDYIAGKRMQYLHPVKMYIFISLVFFVLAFQNNKQDADPDPKSKKAASSKLKSELNKNIESDSSLTTEQKSKIKKGIAVAGIDTAQDDDQSIKVRFKDSDKRGDITLFGISNDKNDTYAKYLARQDSLPAGKRDNFFSRYIKKKTYDWQGKKDAKEVFTESFNHNVPKMMFILLPLCALILKLAFWKNHKFYVEHLIYTIHLHCYLFLTFILLMIFHMILPPGWKSINDSLGFVAFLYVVWYIYKSFKVVYQRSRLRTITKMIGVSLMYFFSLALCFMVIIAVTAIFSA